MSDGLYYALSAVLALGVLYGIRLMSNVRTAARGNRFSALCMLLAVAVTMARTDLRGSLVYILLGLLAGILLSVFMTVKVRMIQMPQMVGLLNGLGGLASAVAAVMTLALQAARGGFEVVSAGLALAVGALTFSGSLVAAAKLHGLMSPKPRVLPGHSLMSALSAILMAALVVLMPLFPLRAAALCLPLGLLGLVFGWLFAVRVGGADMPITISLLNATSGVAAGIAGMALGDVLLVAVGGIVGASGLLLTQIMCRAMNRSLSGVLFGRAGVPSAPAADGPVTAGEGKPEEAPAAASLSDAKIWIAEAKSVVIIPGYGMALSQAQERVKKLQDALAAKEKAVRYAIHPVAGRMPGHMNVLLAEADVPYELLREMEEVNPDFPDMDLAVVVGANDVVNPAANTAQGTPIYGMPILEAGKAKHLIICNFDDKPGYAGVPNPLYAPRPDVLLLLGDAKDSLDQLLELV